MKVLRRDIPWETYRTAKLISDTGLQLLRRYDKKPENYKAQLLDDVINVIISLLGFDFSSLLSYCYCAYVDVTCYAEFLECQTQFFFITV